MSVHSWITSSAGNGLVLFGPASGLGSVIGLSAPCGNTSKMRWSRSAVERVLCPVGCWISWCAMGSTCGPRSSSSRTSRPACARSFSYDSRLSRFQANQCWQIGLMCSTYSAAVIGSTRIQSVKASRPPWAEGFRHFGEECAAALVVERVLDVDHRVDALGLDGPRSGHVGDAVVDPGSRVGRGGLGLLSGERNLAGRAIEADHVAAVLACEEAGGFSHAASGVDDELVALDPQRGHYDLDESAQRSWQSDRSVDVLACASDVYCVPVPEVDVLVVVVPKVEVLGARGVMVDDAGVVFGRCVGSLFVQFIQTGSRSCMKFGAVRVHGFGVGPWVTGPERMKT